MTSLETTSSASALPDALFTAEQVREMDRSAIEEEGIPGIVLMKRAGRAALEELIQRWGSVEEITVLCGAGNNAGDGYIIAGLAAQRRLPVNVVFLSDPESLRGDAALAYGFARQEGVVMQPYAEGVRLRGIVVDALLGTGLQGEVRPAYRTVIEALNRSGLPVLAVDIPSGLCADTGIELGVAVTAQVTVSFIGLKRGLFTGRGPACCGDLVYADLGVPAHLLQAAAQHGVTRNDLFDLLEEFPQRHADAHKGDFGHVLVVGGDHGFGGAAMMAAEAAARAGAGLVSVATRQEHVTAMLVRRPEVMCLGVSRSQELQPLLDKASVVVIGPGLGRSSWSEQLLMAVLRSKKPMVVDADGLNLFAALTDKDSLLRDDWVLTPHPGEAARLLNQSTEDISRDRFSAAIELQKRYRGNVLLKGAGTLIAGEQGVSVNVTGNPGMATGGMGDVLSGIIGGLMAQGLEPNLASRLGAAVHGAAADRVAAESGQRGMLATDLFGPLQQILNHCG